MGGEVSQPHQVERGCGECEHPSDPSASAVLGLAHPGKRFDPAENLLDTFALPLTRGIVAVPCGLFVDGAGAVCLFVLGHVRRRLDRVQ